MSYRIQKLVRNCGECPFQRDAECHHPWVGGDNPDIKRPVVEWGAIPRLCQLRDNHVEVIAVTP